MATPTKMLWFMTMVMCGTAHALTGGFVPKPGDFPSTVLINSNDGYHLCTAAVISSHHLLTAAHCLHGKDNFNGDRIQAGKIINLVSQYTYDAYINGLKYPQQGGIKVAAVYSHPSWPQTEPSSLCRKAEKNGWADVAIIRTVQALKFPIARVRSDAVNAGDQILIGGYGLNRRYEHHSSRINMAIKTVKSVLATYFMVSGLDSNSYMDHGDSGGPVYAYSPNFKKLAIVGINSCGVWKSLWSRGDASTATRVDNSGKHRIADWINAVVNRH